MTNEEQYKTVAERTYAMNKYCAAFRGEGCKKCPIKDVEGDCSFVWLALDVDVAQAMPCPNCDNTKIKVMHTPSPEDEEDAEENSYQVVCEECGYHSPWASSLAEVIAKHNRICKAVNAAEEQAE